MNNITRIDCEISERVIFSTKKRDYDCSYDDSRHGWEIYSSVNHQDFKYKTMLFSSDKNLTADALYKLLVADFKNKLKLKTEFPDNYGKESHKPVELHRADLNKYLNKGENKYLQYLLQDLDTILYRIIELYDNNHIFDANYRAFTRTQKITHNIYANITKDLDFKTEEGAS